MGSAAERPTDSDTPDVELELDDSSMGEINEEEFDLGDLVDGDEETDKAPAAPSADAKPAPAASPAATAPAAGAEAQPPKTGTTAAADASAAAPTDQPFTYRADRSSYTIDGSKLTPEGDLVIPKAQLAEVTRLLSQGRSHEGSFRQTLQRLTERANAAEQQVERIKKEPNEEVVKARAINKFWMELLEKGPDAVAEHLDEFQKTRMLIEARQEREYAQALRSAGPAPAAAAAQAEPQIEAKDLQPELTRLIGELKGTDATLGVLTDDDVKDLTQHLGQDAWLERIFFVADQDIPDRGILKGDIVADTQVLQQEMGRIARVRAAAAQSATAASAADARNKPRLEGRSQGLPPVVTGSGKAAGEGKGKEKKTFKSKAEFDEYYANLPIEEVLKR